MQVDFILTVQRVLILFILIVIGYVAGKTNLISQKGQKDITQLVLYITMPATIFQAMQLEFNVDRIQTSIQIVFIMVILYIVMYGVGWASSRKIPATAAQKDIFHTSLFLSNTSFMGYPIVLSLLGQEALFYAVVGAGFIFEIVSWSLGTYMISRKGTVQSEFNWKNILFSPGIVASIFGLIFFITQWNVPEPFNGVLEMMAPATSPLAMIVIGLMLSRSNIFEALQNKVLYFAAFIKLLLVPIIVALIMRAIGISGPQLVIPVVMISMPTATYVAMFSQNYGNDEKFASQLIFVLSIFSIITIPIVSLFL